ncbi:MAG: hypothetical protein KF830_12490 [Planctomycetes bacterium]|nr:hypothetical protein [Planctomycetota bacterium]
MSNPAMNPDVEAELAATVCACDAAHTACFTAASPRPANAPTASDVAVDEPGDDDVAFAGGQQHRRFAQRHAALRGGRRRAPAGPRRLWRSASSPRPVLGNV